ncbi:hypothetical protein GJ496_001135 [Pomphorhynchus laevis]|nr:hypothetical protein GJ496_001135 [Pomphorhynchus laevis]
MHANIELGADALKNVQFPIIDCQLSFMHHSRYRAFQDTTEFDWNRTGEVHLNDNCSVSIRNASFRTAGHYRIIIFTEYYLPEFENTDEFGRYIQYDFSENRFISTLQYVYDIRINFIIITTPTITAKVVADYVESLTCSVG